MSRRHTIVSARDLDRPAYQRLVGTTYDDGRVLAVEVQRDQWIALVEQGECIEFVPCEVVARRINETEAGAWLDALERKAREGA